MASSTGNSDAANAEIRLWQEEDWWIARDVESGVTTQGKTREAALQNLDDAVELYEGERGREPTEGELRELGIDPDDTATGEEAPPDVLD